MKAFGLDLSLSCTGIARADGRTERLEPRRSDGIMRLAWLRDAILDRVVDDLDRGEDLVALEDLPHGVRNAAAGPLGMLHGVIRLALVEMEYPTLLVTPSTLKTYATGKGNATKADMRVELIRRADFDLRDDNECDAWWLRALALGLAGEPILELPNTHTRALTKLALPTEV